jgi:hypothetical protein
MKLKNHLVMLCLIGISFYSHAVTRYVTPAGAGSMNGSSWANAYPAASLQNAITLSASGDEVWVASGVYYTTTGTNRSISFSMKSGVAIYGSLTGTETAISQRNLTSGLSTTLSAEIGTAGLSDNSYHTISNSNLNTTAILDGFVIRDANDDRPATLTDGLGGGIYNNGSNSTFCNPTIRNCIITNNRAVFGAGVFNNAYNSGSAGCTLMNCVIVTNTATTGGGGIDNFGVLNGNANPTLLNCVVYNNTAAQRAGGMYCWGGNNGNANPIVINSVFVNNSAIDGGAVVTDRLNTSTGSSGNSNPNFRNCIFWGNTASGTGPQFFTLGGATFVSTYTDIDMTGQTSPHVISGAGTGTINSNPLFISIASGAGLDGKWLTSDDGLQLQSSSPCINAGSNASTPGVDILNNPRIVNLTVDLGAYESNYTTSVFENTKNDRVIVYPNPAKGSLNFSGLEHSTCRIKIINMIGVMVKDCDLKNNSVNINDLAAGSYIILIETPDQNIVKHHVINE